MASQLGQMEVFRLSPVQAAEKASGVAKGPGENAGSTTKNHWLASHVEQAFGLPFSFSTTLQCRTGWSRSIFAVANVGSRDAR